MFAEKESFTIALHCDKTLKISCRLFFLSSFMVIFFFRIITIIGMTDFLFLVPFYNLPFIVFAERIISLDKKNIHKQIEEMCPPNIDVRDCYNGLMNLWMRYMLSRNIVWLSQKIVWLSRNIVWLSRNIVWLSTTKLSMYPKRETIL